MSINRNSLILLCVWSIIGMLSIFIVGGNYTYNLATAFVGLITIFHGLYYFNMHGGNYITPTGLFLLYSSVLHGFASISINQVAAYEVTRGHYIASLSTFFLQVIVYHWILSDYQEKNLNGFKKVYTRPPVNRFIILVGVIGFGLGVISPTFGELGSAAIYVTIVILVIRNVLLVNKVNVHHFFYSMGLFSIYYLFLFASFGRINLVTLLAIIAMIFSYKLNTKVIKLFITVMFYPSIMIGSYLRSGDLFDISSGVGSIISPFYRFGQLVDLYMDHVISLDWGRTIYAAFIVIIPREIWPNKPWNFNREITFLFTPQYIADGHSEAAVFNAEMMYNFGFVGIVLGGFLLGWLISKMEKEIFIKYAMRRVYDIKDLVFLSFSLIVASGLMNLLWGGFSTFINRDGFRLLLLITAFYSYEVFFLKKEEAIYKAK